MKACEDLGFKVHSWLSMGTTKPQFKLIAVINALPYLQVEHQQGRNAA